MIRLARWASRLGRFSFRFLSGEGNAVNDIFITENFLLENDAAARLYHEYARDMPIIDYHCHLPPQQIAADHRFENLTQVWLYGDHYKWRAMRSSGVARAILHRRRHRTGRSSRSGPQTVPKTLRNPLYHWTHLELKRPVRHQRPAALGPKTARGIWDECNALLAERRVLLPRDHARR